MMYEKCMESQNDQIVKKKFVRVCVRIQSKTVDEAKQWLAAEELNLSRFVELALRDYNLKKRNKFKRNVTNLYK